MKYSNWIFSRGTGPGRKLFPKCRKFVWHAKRSRKSPSSWVLLWWNLMKWLIQEPPNVQAVPPRGLSTSWMCCEECFTTSPPMRQGFRGTLALDVPQCEFQTHELSFYSLGTAPENGIGTVSSGGLRRKEGHGHDVPAHEKDCKSTCLATFDNHGHKKPTRSLQSKLWQFRLWQMKTSLKVGPRWGHEMPSSLSLHQVQVPLIILNVVHWVIRW